MDRKHPDKPFYDPWTQSPSVPDSTGNRGFVKKRHCYDTETNSASYFGNILINMNISKGFLHRLSSGVTGLFVKLSTIAPSSHDSYGKRLMK